VFPTRVFWLFSTTRNPGFFIKPGYFKNPGIAVVFTY